MKVTGTERQSPVWRTSSHSQAGSGDCVEVAGSCLGGVLVRDSKNPRGPVLELDVRGWSALVRVLKGDAHDL
ncbi:DUF397 domain-containing protein [Spirillospora sp. CA-255316]